MTARNLSQEAKFQFKEGKQWRQLDVYQEEQLGEPDSQLNVKLAPQQRNIKPSTKKNLKKHSQVEEYQKALDKLRSQVKGFHKPFEKQRLNLSLMQSIRMLKEAIDKDKDYGGVLRTMGCKTRMRVRNKTAAKELFEVMLKYLQEGHIPEWMKDRHKSLLQKPDDKFDHYMRSQD